MIGELITSDQRAIVVALLSRYGVKRIKDLLPEHQERFSVELGQVFAGKAQDPRDSYLDPSMCEIRTPSKENTSFST